MQGQWRFDVDCSVGASHHGGHRYLGSDACTITVASRYMERRQSYRAILSLLPNTPEERGKSVEQDGQLGTTDSRKQWFRPCSGLCFDMGGSEQEDSAGLSSAYAAS